MNDHYAIVIGIDSYGKTGDNSGFSRLTSAVKDANAFMGWLVSPTGGDIQNDPTPGRRRIIPIFSPQVLNDQLPTPAEAKPIKDQIDDALTELGFDGSRGRIGERLYFYFSGHGIAFGSSDVAMMMANAVNSMLSRNVGLKTYREYLQERLIFDEVIFIADCCRTRVAVPINPGMPVFTVPAHPPPIQMQDTVILAAEYGDPSYAISDGQGLLTKALLEALNGDPDAVDQKGRVTSNTLNVFLPERVKALAKQNLLRQIPEMDLFPKKAEIIFAKPRKKITIQIIADGNINGEIFVCDSQDQEITSVGRRGAKTATTASPWAIELFDSSIPYRLKVTTFSNPFILELSKVKENGNVFQIP